MARRMLSAVEPDPTPERLPTIELPPLPAIDVRIPSAMTGSVESGEDMPTEPFHDAYERVGFIPTTPEEASERPAYLERAEEREAAGTAPKPEDPEVANALKLRSELHAAVILLRQKPEGVDVGIATKYYSDRSKAFHTTMNTIGLAKQDVVLNAWNSGHPRECVSPKCEHYKRVLTELSGK